MDVHDKCSDCGYEFPPSLIRVPCPQCGNTVRTTSGSVSESLKVRDGLGFKIKDPSKTGRSKTRVEGFTRYVPSQKAPLVKHERLIDRGEDKYFERVEDADTGEVFHHNEEPLTAHIEHGTAKKKDDRSAHSDEINWKGIGDYLSAARTLADHGSSNTSGPRTHCQGLALELALKFYLRDKTGTYPRIHDLETLAIHHCQDIHFSTEEVASIQQINRQYLKDGEYSYPSRYRPSEMRVVPVVAQSTLEDLIAKIIRGTSRSDLIPRIMSR